MTATELLGGNYTIREDSNGDYEIEHNTLGFVLRFSDANDVLSFLKDVEVGDVIDESSGNTVYDSSTETFGDGNQDANLNSVSADKASIRRVATVVEMSSDQTVSSDTNTTVQFDSIVFDQFNSWDTSNHKYVVPEDGTYAMQFRVMWLDTADVEFRNLVDVGGSVLTFGRYFPGGNLPNYTESSPLIIEELTAGDDFSFDVLQKDTGTSHDLRSTIDTQGIVYRIG